MFFFFFFQAEDGIRDVAVTGVQTCALPISRAPIAARLWKHLEGWLHQHAEQGFPPVRAAWKRAAATLGKKVKIQEEGRLIEGTAVDIDEFGALLVENARGQIERVVAGDLEQAP